MLRTVHTDDSLCALPQSWLIKTFKTIIPLKLISCLVDVKHKHKLYQYC